MTLALYAAIFGLASTVTFLDQNLKQMPYTANSIENATATLRQPITAILPRDDPRAFVSPSTKISPKNRKKYYSAIEKDPRVLERSLFFSQDGYKSDFSAIHLNPYIASNGLSQIYDMKTNADLALHGVIKMNSANIDERHLLVARSTIGEDRISARDHVSDPRQYTSENKGECTTSNITVDTEPATKIQKLSNAEYVHALSNFLYQMLLTGFSILIVLADKRSHRVILALLILLLISNG